MRTFAIIQLGLVGVYWATRLIGRIMVGKRDRALYNQIRRLHSEKEREKLIEVTGNPEAVNNMMDFNESTALRMLISVLPVVNILGIIRNIAYPFRVDSTIRKFSKTMAKILDELLNQDKKE